MNVVDNYVVVAGAGDAERVLRLRLVIVADFAESTIELGLDLSDCC